MERDTNSAQSSTVSIIVPTFNASSTIEKCLGAITTQDYPNLEIIIVDDASRDDTLEKVSRFEAKIIKKTKNCGVAHSRNLGVKNACSEIIIFVDSDIVIPINAITRIHEILLKQPNILAVGAIYSDNSSKLNFISDFKNMDLAYRCLLCPENVKYLGSFFLAIKRGTFLKAGGFSTNFPGSSVEDIDFGYKVSKGKAVMLIDKYIRVDHLKKYTLPSMLKVDFNRIVNMVRIIKTSKGKYKAGEYAPSPYFINVFLPGLIILSFIIGIKFKIGCWPGLLLILMFIINNFGFINFLMKRKGVIFTIKSIIVLFIEYIVIEASILLSLFISIPRISQNSRSIDGKVTNVSK